MITQAFHASQDAAPEGHQNRLKLFLILFILHVKQGEVSKSDPSEIRFPMTLTSGAFLNQKTNYKQTSLESCKNLASNCISFCASSGKRQLKASQKTLSVSAIRKQVSRCSINFPHELTCQLLTNQNIKTGRRA